eukprot:4291453-Amphidinium_carterae.2
MPTPPMPPRPPTSQQVEKSYYDDDALVFGERTAQLRSQHDPCHATSHSSFCECCKPWLNLKSFMEDGPSTVCKAVRSALQRNLCQGDVCCSMPAHETK